MSTGDDFTPASYEESKLVVALHGYPRIDSADTFSLDGDYWTAVEVMIGFLVVRGLAV
jgi:hypothetical protein